MAKPYQEGRGWCVRARHESHDVYLSGYPTKAAVLKAMTQRKVEIDRGRAPREPGPERVCLAQAMQTYALERLRFLKGAVQDAVRINHYLRYTGLDLLDVKPLAKVEGQQGAQEPDAPNVYFCVSLKPHTTERKIPKGLGAYRSAQLTKNANTERHRAVLAGKRMSDITRSDVQQFMNSMVDDGNAAATVALERALLRGVFNYARTTWRWLEHRENPCTSLKLPAVRNVRKRCMSPDEQSAMDLAIASCRNKLVGPTVALLRETGMRTSEPLSHARWKNVNWDRRILTLDDGKTGSREVPLSPAAVQALRELNPGAPDDLIVRITYEALRGAWNDACRRAGVTDLQLYDLRRTAATRMGLKTGNVFLVQALTGHKTIEMVMRYMNVTADDAVAVLHAPVEPSASLPVVQSCAAQGNTNQTVTLTTKQLREFAAMAVTAARSTELSGVGSEGDVAIAANVVRLPVRQSQALSNPCAPLRPLKSCPSPLIGNNGVEYPCVAAFIK